MADFQNFSNQHNQSKGTNFFSDMQFGKIFNNTNNEQKASNIDEVFANTLVPITEKVNYEKVTQM